MTTEKKVKEMTFDQWMYRVDQIIMRKVSMTHDDIPDKDYYSMWSSETSPAECVTQVFEDEGYDINDF